MSTVPPPQPAPAASRPPGAILRDEVVPARAGWSARITAGDVLRLVDLEGQQAVDFLCFDAADPAERYHAPNTIKIPRQVYLRRGTILYSNRARPLMTLIADTMGDRDGRGHDTIFGCCSQDVDRMRYGRVNARSCQGNFEAELARWGVGAEHVVPNANFFMSVPIAADGAAAIVDSSSRPGDFVDLRAERDVLAVLSNCPEELNAASGANGPTPIRALVWRPA